MQEKVAIVPKAIEVQKYRRAIERAEASAVSFLLSLEAQAVASSAAHDGVNAAEARKAYAAFLAKVKKAHAAFEAKA